MDIALQSRKLLCAPDHPREAMTDRKLTTAGEVACYLGAHIIGYIIAIFWSPVFLYFVRLNFGDSALTSISSVNSLVLIFIAMFLFLFGRKLLIPQSFGQQGGKLTTATEAGSYLFARGIGYTIAVAWNPILLRYLRESQGANAGGLSPLFVVSSLVLIIVVMFLFFFMRMYMPRFNRVWFTFAGRCSRFEYWVYYVVPLYAVVALAVVAPVINMTQPWARGAFQSMWIWGLFLMWPGLAVGVKRCHDRNRSGWFLLIGLIPIIGGIWLFIEIGLLRGTIGPNRFGPDPVSDGAPQPAAAT
jgi:uncharacterized membrane protein YhaH (DUF805 family)